MNQALFSYIAACPTAFQAAAHTAALLEAEGYRPLRETEEWMLEPGGRYYVMRNGSSLIAFRLPKGRPVGFMMTAAHGDSPTFKIKENAELAGEYETRLSVEGYGGMLCASWMDRPLSVAGRAMVRTENGVAMRLIDLHDDLALIPNVAIHMNREANNGTKYNFAVDMQPLYGEKGGFHRRIAEAAGVAEEDLLTHDLFLYNPQPGVEWGGYISAPRLDDLQCAFAALQGFLTAGESQSAAVYCLFDNEEVGSQTKQGAASTFLRETLERIQLELIALMGEVGVLDEDREKYLASKIRRIEEADLARLDDLVDELETEERRFTGWVLAGTSPHQAALHVARAVCRRAERDVLALRERGETLGDLPARYLNRLSDVLWLLARD